MKEKSMKWAIVGALLFPLAAYVYVAPQGRKKYGWAKGILMSAILWLGYRGWVFVSVFIPELLDYVSILTVAALAFHGFIIYDVYRLTRKYNKVIKEAGLGNIP